MKSGFLENLERIDIRLGPDREILSASDAVFKDVHQEEARNVIYEAGFLSDFFDEFSKTLSVGRARMVSVAEPGRQTSFGYLKEGGVKIILTRAHRNFSEVVKELEGGEV